MEEKKRLIVIDANSILHRAFHALPPLTTKKGEQVSAVYGFLLVLFRALREFQPDFIAACFDLPQPTFRHQKFEGYKAKRPPTPKELSCQIPQIKEVLRTFDVSVFEKAGFEADDIIGTIAKTASKEQTMPGLETIILSGDLDTLQLVDENTRVYFLQRGVKEIVLYDEARVKARYGISPEQLVDFKALRGDPSDNIPGVPGIGEKTAAKLIQQAGNLKNLFQEIKAPNELKAKLQKYKEQILLSKTLVALITDVPINFDFEKCRWGKYDKERVTQLLKEFEFYSLLKRLPETEKRSQREQNEEKKLVKENLRLW